jgi:site-specific DNA-methyltransferase (adenine-specific)
MGSGTTGISCLLNDRQFVGIEMDEKYFQIAEARIDAYKVHENGE